VFVPIPSEYIFSSIGVPSTLKSELASPSANRVQLDVYAALQHLSWVAAEDSYYRRTDPLDIREWYQLGGHCNLTK
jgi:hypothetical protein